MDGVSASAASLSTLQASTESSSAVQMKVLSKAIEHAGESLLPLIEGLGENVDVSA